jgi:hypothetical protein
VTNELSERYRNDEARLYEERRSANPKWQFEHEALRRVLQTHAARIRSIIDAPVGTGRFLDLYRQCAGDATIHGFDASPDMLQMARHRAESDRVVLQKADIINEPLSAHADLVVCYRFLNLVPWDAAVATLRHLFAAADQLLVVAIRTVPDDYDGPTFIEDKIHLHRQTEFEHLCAEQGATILDMARIETGRAGDYSIVTCSTARQVRTSRVNKNGRLIYTYENGAGGGKVYEVANPEHAAFIVAIGRQPDVTQHFPMIRRTDDAFVDAAWVPGELLPASSWGEAVDLLVKIQSLDTSLCSSFDYVEGLVVPRFRRAAPVVGRRFCDRVVAAIFEHSEELEPRVSHPDVIPGNVVVSDAGLAVVDNELLCRSRHWPIDLLNLLNNLPPALRAPMMARYLRLTGQTLARWESRGAYLRPLWCARQIGSAVVLGDVERAKNLAEAYEAGEWLMPYDAHVVATVEP